MKMKINKPNKSIVSGSMLIGLGLSAAAMYAAAPKIKNLTNKISNKMSNNDYNSMQ